MPKKRLNWSFDRAGIDCRNCTDDAPIYVEGVGPGWLRIAGLVSHHGEISALYVIDSRAGWINEWQERYYLRRIGPDVLECSTKPKGFDTYYDFHLVVSRNKVVQVKPYANGSEREYLIFSRCKELLEWMLPLQEYVDRILGDMGLTEADLPDFNLGACVDKHEKALPQELYGYAKVLANDRRLEEEAKKVARHGEED